MKEDQTKQYEIWSVVTDGNELTPLAKLFTSTSLTETYFKFQDMVKTIPCFIIYN